MIVVITYTNPMKHSIVVYPYFSSKCCHVTGKMAEAAIDVRCSIPRTLIIKK